MALEWVEGVITKIENDCHWVTAIDETLLKTSLNTWKPKDEIKNLKLM